MRSVDVIELYSATPVGTPVSIVSGKLPGPSQDNPFVAFFALAESVTRGSHL